MAFTGTQLVAGRIPGERIATTIATADSATTTTSVLEVDSVTAPLVSGRTYRVRLVAAVDSSATDDRIRVRLHEDDTAGTQLQNLDVIISGAVSAGLNATVEAEFTAVSTADKTFVSSIARLNGTGNVFATGGSTSPRYLYVDYIRG